MARGGGRASDLRESGDGVRLGLLADAQPKACLTREAEGTLEDRLAGTGILAPHLLGLSAWASHPAPPSLSEVTRAKHDDWYLLKVQ